MYCHEIGIRFHLQNLIESGVSLEDRDDFGDMPIHYAAKSGGFSIIITLIETGVQPRVAGTFCWLEVWALGLYVICKDFVCIPLDDRRRQRCVTDRLPTP